jgi:hypothetical protein
MRFSGRCFGGPNDGKDMVHWKSTVEYFKPAVALPMNSSVVPMPVLVGKYKHDGNGCWWWREGLKT